MDRVALAALVYGLLSCGTTEEPAGDDDTGDTGAPGTTSTSAGPDTTVPGDTTNADGSGTTGAPAPETGDGSTGSGAFPPPELDECIDDASAGMHVYECEGLTYDVEIPPQCLEAPCGLVVDVHGFTMSGQMQNANTNMRAHGIERGYIVIQPNATPAPPAASWTPGADDELVFAFMMRVALALHVDTNRLHFSGFSQGGAMSWRFACLHSDVLASVAPAAACNEAGGGVLEDCSFMGEDAPEEPLPILYMHGTTDALINYACAEPRRDAVIEAFGLGPEEVVSEGEGYRWTRHSGPDRGLIEFISHDYSAASGIIGGHCYPGSDDPGDAPGQLFSFKCEGENGFTWGEAVIDFFEAHPRE